MVSTDDRQDLISRLAVGIIAALIVPIVIEAIGLMGWEAGYFRAKGFEAYRPQWQMGVLCVAIASGLFIFWRLLGFSFGLILICAVYIPVMYLLLGFLGIGFAGGI